MIAVRKVRVAVVLFNQKDELLLCRQNNKPFWVLPGGTLDPDETILECAVRELKEEANLDIRVKHLVGLSDFLRAEQPQALDITCYAELLGGAFKMASDESLNAMGFYTLEEVREVPVMPKYVKTLILECWQNKDFPSSTYLHP